MMANHGGRRRLSKIIRYGAASSVTTVITLVLLGVLLLAVTPGWANLAAVTTGSVISFELNRRWVWRHSDRRRRWTQLLLFVCMSLIFLALSNVAVREVGAAVQSTGTMTRLLLVESTTVAVFGVRWATQYLFLDRVLFRARAPLMPAEQS
jgi:putative flippase GtrA